MAVDSSNAVSQSQIISSTSKTTNTKKSNTLNMENFLSLLVAEMQNQDPLEPTSNSDYMAQMATFSQVEATTEMNEKVLSQTASNLIGKAVIVKTDMNTSGYAGGVVNGWQEIDGIIYLGINGGLYDINDVDQVIDKDYYENGMHLMVLIVHLEVQAVLIQQMIKMDSTDSTDKSEATGSEE